MAKYHMYKKEREITDRDTLITILSQGKYTTLSLCRDDEPYIVTLSYGYDRENNAIYFHTAQKGLKLGFIRYNPMVCGTVIEDKGYISGKCAHAYRSLVFWGTMHVIEELDEKKHAMDVLIHHLEENPKPIRKKNLQNDDAYENVGILRLDIEEMTGKAGQ